MEVSIAYFDLQLKIHIHKRIYRITKLNIIRTQLYLKITLIQFFQLTSIIPITNTQ